MVDYSVKANIRRSIETGELLHLEYFNKSENDSAYFFGINFIQFHDDESKIIGLAYNYQYQEPIQLTIALNRIKSAKCVEGTRHFHHNKLQTYMKVPEIHGYFTDEVTEKGLLDYYADCVEGSTDLQYVSGYFVDSVDVDILLEKKTHKLNKEEIDELLMLLNVDQEKAKVKYKLAFNVMAVSNHQKELIPVAYYDLFLDVFEKEITIDDSLLHFHKKNVSKLLFMPIDDVEEFQQLEDLYQVLEEEIRDNQLIDTNPAIMKLKLDLTFSVRKDYQVIKDSIYGKNELSSTLKAFFGKGTETILEGNKNVYFTNNKVNARQIEAVYSALNHNLTYVQGPPGTGKTETIRNIIVSSFMNQETTLITSYTNEAVNNVLNKMKLYTYKGIKIPLPMIRVGSIVSTNVGMKYIRDAYQYFQKIRMDLDFDELKNMYKKAIEQEIYKLNGITELFLENSKYEDAELKIDVYDKLLEAIPEGNRFYEKKEKVKKLISSQKGVLTKLKKKDLDNYLDNISLDYETISLGLLLKSYEKWMLLDNSKYKGLRDIIVNSSETDQKNFYSYFKNEELLSILLDVFPIVFTTNVSARNIGKAHPIFDLLIMDEAGQCENAYSLVALSRARRAALIGDPNQLLPVVTLSDFENEKFKSQNNIPMVYDYKKTSVLNTMNQVDFSNDIIVLNKHYRSKKSIVDFSNKKYYRSELDIQNTKVSQDDCKFIDVKSHIYRSKKNTSVEEAMAIIEELKKIPSSKTVGIITPYRNQQSFITTEVKKHVPDKSVKIGTVHKFQGQEEDVIMLSLGVSRESYKGSFDWLKNNKQLINVATTRPKDQLIVVGDHQSILALSNDEQSDILDLIRYTSEYNVETFDKSSVGMIYQDITAKSMYTSFEGLFHDTLYTVLKTNYQGLRVEGQKSLVQLIKIDDTHPFFTYAKQSSLDFVIINNHHQPLLAIELNGPEHSFDPVVIERDKIKKELCIENGIELISVSNRDSRRYYLIKEILSSIFNPVNNNLYKVGDQVQHDKFGIGTVKEIKGNKLIISFNYKERVFKSDHRSIVKL